MVGVAVPPLSKISSMPTVGVIGLGQMAKAVVEPLLQRGVLQPSEILAVVATMASRQKLLETLPEGVTICTADNPSAAKVWQAPVQLLAVKPQQLDQISASCDAKLTIMQDRPLLISILAGVCLQRLQRCFPHHICVRAVPNISTLVGAGLTGIAWGDGTLDTQKGLTLQLFQPVSEVLELPESQLDAFLALASSGPAYVALVAEAMADGAVAAGLPRQLALHLACQTLAGTAALLRLYRLHPGQLKDMVASPAGVTMAGLRHLEHSGFRSALIESIVVATERSKQLS